MVSYSIVQFVDDTLIIGHCNWDNLWCIKALLRGFESLSGLWVNFFNSSIGGVNLSSEFLEATSVFLHCGIRRFHSKFWAFV